MRVKHLLLLSAVGTVALAGCQPNSDSGLTEAKEVVSEVASTPEIISTTPIVLPGAPGQSARTLSAEEAIDIADNSYSPDDVIFMQNMIPHHAQAARPMKLNLWRIGLKNAESRSCPVEKVPAAPMKAITGFITWKVWPRPKIWLSSRH